MAGRPKAKGAQATPPLTDTDEGWLLLIHQVPPKPAYLRVKVWRRLQRLGAVALKNSVYVLPLGEQTQEDFQWVRREIVADGGDATICAARFVDGLTDDQVHALFHAARDVEYGEIAEEARRAAEGFAGNAPLDSERQAELEATIVRLKRRLRDVIAIDFFTAPGQEAAEALISGLEQRLGATKAKTRREPGSTEPLPTNATWVTRQGIHIDRIASAWLIRRFIDHAARFKFVPAKGYRAAAGEIRFDMFEAEFTHEGDRCTFEVLLDRAAIDDPALAAIAEIVHDLDLKDGKFARTEAAGIDRLIAGMAMSHKDDNVRLERGAAIFEDLYQYFRRKRPARAT